MKLFNFRRSRRSEPQPQSQEQRHPILDLIELTHSMDELSLKLMISTIRLGSIEHRQRNGCDECPVLSELCKMSLRSTDEPSTAMPSTDEPDDS